MIDTLLLVTHLYLQPLDTIQLNLDTTQQCTIPLDVELTTDPLFNQELELRVNYRWNF
jgi:hypothetical protein